MYSLFISNPGKAWAAMRALPIIFFINLRVAVSCGFAISANILFFRREFVVHFPVGYFVVAALFKMQ